MEKPRFWRGEVSIWRREVESRASSNRPNEEERGEEVGSLMGDLKGEDWWEEEF